MKNAIYLLLVSLALAAVSFTQPPGSLKGQWQQKLAGNVTVKSIYRTDGSFDIFVNGKTFVSGKYKVNQDTLFISDPVCGLDYYGRYRLTFVTPDSVRQSLLEDTCQVRSHAIRQSPALSRLKGMKP